MCKVTGQTSFIQHSEVCVCQLTIMWRHNNHNSEYCVTQQWDGCMPDAKQWIIVLAIVS